MEYDKLIDQLSDKKSQCMQARANQSHLTQGSFKSQFYKLLDMKFQEIFLDYNERYWSNSIVLDIGSGFGAGLFGFNFVLGVQKLIGIEIQRKLVKWQSKILDRLTEHNGRTNWEYFESYCCDLNESQTDLCLHQSDVVFCLNLKFDSKDNETLRTKIIESARVGTVIITIYPLGRQRLATTQKCTNRANLAIPSGKSSTSVNLNLLGGFRVPDEVCSWHSRAKRENKHKSDSSHNFKNNIHCYIYQLNVA